MRERREAEQELGWRGGVRWGGGCPQAVSRSHAASAGQLAAFPAVRGPRRRRRRRRPRVASALRSDAYQDHWDAGLMVLELREPLGLDIFKRRARDQRESHQKDVSLRVGERSQAIVILLSCSVPKPKVDGLAVDHDVGTVVVEDGRHVILRHGTAAQRGERSGSVRGRARAEGRQVLPRQRTPPSARHRVESDDAGERSRRAQCDVDTRRPESVRRLRATWGLVGEKTAQGAMYTQLRRD